LSEAWAGRADAQKIEKMAIKAGAKRRVVQKWDFEIA
jgi:hypothetical protein